MERHLGNIHIVLRISARLYFIFLLWPLLFSCSHSNDDQQINSLIDLDGDGVSDNTDQCNYTPNGVQVDENGCIAYIYFDENEDSLFSFLGVRDITIKAYEYAEVGDAGVVNGVTYMIVDEAMLREMIANGEDVTRVCTTKVTDMSGMFSGSDFNQNIRSWDVSNVTNMNGMFRDALSFDQILDSWDVENVRSCDDFGYNTPKWHVLAKPRFTNCIP